MQKLRAVKSAGGGQGLLIEEETGRNVAVTYEEKDAVTIVNRMELLYDLLECLRSLYDEKPLIAGEYFGAALCNRLVENLKERWQI